MASYTSLKGWVITRLEASISIGEMLTSRMEANLEDYKRFGMYEEAKAQIDRARKIDREMRAYCDRKKADLSSPAQTGRISKLGNSKHQDN